MIKATERGQLTRPALADAGWGIARKDPKWSTFKHVRLEDGTLKVVGTLTDAHKARYFRPRETVQE